MNSRKKRKEAPPEFTGITPSQRRRWVLMVILAGLILTTTNSCLDGGLSGLIDNDNTFGQEQTHAVL